MNFNYLFAVIVGTANARQFLVNVALYMFKIWKQSSLGHGDNSQKYLLSECKC